MAADAAPARRSCCVVVVAIVSGLVFGGVVQGSKTYAGPGDAPTTQPTVLIEP